jgi:ribosomal protein L5
LTEEEIITLVLEQIIPEIDIDKVNKISGMDISFVTTAKQIRNKVIID